MYIYTEVSRSSDNSARATMAISRGVTLILIFSLLTTVRSWNNDILADGFRWSGCSALEPGTKMRHECNCEYYYTCTTNDILLLSRCRNVTTFDPLAKSCVYEWSSGCKSDNCNTKKHPLVIRSMLENCIRINATVPNSTCVI